VFEIYATFSATFLKLRYISFLKKAIGFFENVYFLSFAQILLAGFVSILQHIFLVFILYNLPIDFFRIWR